MRFIPKKLKNGYYTIENELGETVKRIETFNAVLFEFRDTAVTTARRLKYNWPEKGLTF